MLYISQVSVIDMTVTFLYDMNDCAFERSEWTATDHFYWPKVSANAWGMFFHYSCPNPLALISNYAQMEIENVIINMNVTESDRSINATQNGRCFNFEDVGDYGFISNYGTVNIHNLTMERSLSRYMLYNEGMSSWFVHCFLKTNKKLVQ